MYNRILRWLTFDFIFALFPFIFTVLLRYLMGTLSIDHLAESPEILFFAIMVSATATGDLHAIATPVGWDNLLRSLYSITLLGAVFCSVLYGTFLYDTLMGSNSLDFRQNLFDLSIAITIAMTLISFVVEVLIARIEEK